MTGQGVTEAIQKHEGIVLHCARAFYNQLPRSLQPAIDLEDLEQVARIALWEAANRYDEARGTVFWLFARQRVRGALIDAMRTQGIWNRKKKPAVLPESLDVDLNVEDGNTTTQDSDHGEGAKAIEQGAEMALVARRARGHLTEREASIVVSSLVEGKRLKEVGRDLGIGESRVSQIRGCAIRKLQLLCRAA